MRIMVLGVQGVLRGENSLFNRLKVGIFDHQIFTPLKNKHKIARGPLSPKGTRQISLPSEYFPPLPSEIQTHQHLRALAAVLPAAPDITKRLMVPGVHWRV